MTDKGAGEGLEQDGWQGGDGEGHGQRYTELIQTPKFLVFLPRNFGMPFLQTTTSLKTDTYKIWLEKYLRCLLRHVLC